MNLLKVLLAFAGILGLSNTGLSQVQLLSEYPMERLTYTSDMGFSGDHLYVTRAAWHYDSSANGLFVFKITPKGSLIQQSYQYLGFRPMKLCTLGTYLYVYSYYTVLSVYDISIADSPKFVKSTRLSTVGNGTSMTCDAVNERIYLSNTGDDKLYVVSIADRSNPVIVSTTSTCDGPYQSLRQSNRLYLVCATDNKLNTYDMTNETSLGLLSSVDLGGVNAFVGARIITPLSTNKFLISFWGNWSSAGINVMDNTNRDMPAISAQVLSPSSTVFPVGSQMTPIAPNLMLVGGYYSMKSTIVDFSSVNPSFPLFGNLPVIGSYDRRIDSQAIKDDFLVVATGAELTAPRLTVFKLNMFK